MSKNLNSINNFGFYSNFMKMLEKYHISDLDLDLENLDSDRVGQIETNIILATKHCTL